MSEQGNAAEGNVMGQKEISGGSGTKDNSSFEGIRKSGDIGAAPMPKTVGDVEISPKGQETK